MIDSTSRNTLNCLVRMCAACAIVRHVIMKDKAPTAVFEEGLSDMPPHAPLGDSQSTAALAGAAPAERNVCSFVGISARSGTVVVSPSRSSGRGSSLEAIGDNGPALHMVAPGVIGRSLLLIMSTRSSVAQRPLGALGDSHLTRTALRPPKGLCRGGPPSVGRRWAVSLMRDLVRSLSVTLTCTATFFQHPRARPHRRTCAGNDEAP